MFVLLMQLQKGRVKGNVVLFLISLCVCVASYHLSVISNLALDCTILIISLPWVYNFPVLKSSLTFAEFPPALG
jgi:hypothetical protein